MRERMPADREFEPFWNRFGHSDPRNARKPVLGRSSAAERAPERERGGWTGREPPGVFPSGLGGEGACG